MDIRLILALGQVKLAVVSLNQTSCLVQSIYIHIPPFVICGVEACPSMPWATGRVQPDPVTSQLQIQIY